MTSNAMDIGAARELVEAFSRRAKALGLEGTLLVVNLRGLESLKRCTTGMAEAVRAMNGCLAPDYAVVPAGVAELGRAAWAARAEAAADCTCGDERDDIYAGILESRCTSCGAIRRRRKGGPWRIVGWGKRWTEAEVKEERKRLGYGEDDD